MNKWIIAALALGSLISGALVGVDVARLAYSKFNIPVA